jgi:hypothetical protein
MKRIFDNLVVDLVAAVLMVAMMATGYILRFPLPPGTNNSLSLWGPAPASMRLGSLLDFVSVLCS